jgi:hypothetical protein
VRGGLRECRQLPAAAHDANALESSIDQDQHGVAAEGRSQ